MRKWLLQLVEQYLKAIASLQNTAEGQALAQEWADWMKSQWIAHGMKTLKQQRNLMTEVRNAIKQQLGENHFALESMNFTRAEWIKINQPIEEQVANRNENQCRINAPETIVHKATQLLSSREWVDIAAGLAVLTGRRSSEILATGRFYYKTPYSVTFTGALKRRGEKQTLSFEIPTLAPANQIITAFSKLREWVDTKGMSAEAVNRRYGEAVARACDRHFSDLVPLRQGRNNLYTHLFRTIYARIATHWYAPPNVADVEYMAAIQGHYQVLDEHNNELKRSLVSSRHYNDYKIGDSQGNIDGRQGIKLGQPGVEVIEMFNSVKAPVASNATIEVELTLPTPMPDSTPARKNASLRLFQDERDRWFSVLEQVAPNGTQPERMSALLEWIERQLADQATQLATGSESATQQVETEQDLPQAVEVPEKPPAEPAVPAAAEQAWEKISVLTDVLTRLATQFEQQAAATPTSAKSSSKTKQTHSSQAEVLAGNSTGTEVEKSHPSSTTSTTTSTRTKSSSKAQQPHQPQPEAGDNAKSTEQEQSYSTRSIEAEEKVNQAINQIMQHNSTPDLPHNQKWAITLSVLKPATKSYQGVIKRVLEARQQEIDQHHQEHGLGAYHNSLHRKTGAKITDVIHH